jgi:gentisate 1,2-dioxygenase
MPHDTINAPTADTPERRAFYEKIDKKNLTALWLSLADLVTPEPRSPTEAGRTCSYISRLLKGPVMPVSLIMLRSATSL